MLTRIYSRLDSRESFINSAPPFLSLVCWIISIGCGNLRVDAMQCWSYGVMLCLKWGIISNISRDSVPVPKLNVRLNCLIKYFEDN